MVRVLILLAGIGIGFAVAKVLLPLTSSAPGSTACAPQPAQTACVATAPAGAPDASSPGPSSDSGPPAPSVDEPVPHVTVTIPEGGYGNSGDGGADMFTRLGLRKGDVILRINEQSIYSPLEALSLLQALDNAKAPVKEILLRRGGREMTLRPRLK